MELRTTHVGSLPRPAEMVTRQLRKDTLTADDVRRFVDGVVQRQVSLGLTYVNNGELPRSDYISSTVRRISGFGGSAFAPVPKDLEEMPELARRFSGRNGLITLNPKAAVELPACTAELAYVGEDSLRAELEMLTGSFAGCTAGRQGVEPELFFTAPSPGTIALFLANTHYPDYRSYLEKLGEVLQQEYAIIAGYGVILQIDCPDLAMGRHTTYKAMSDDQFLALMDANISVLNDALSGVWGNYPGTHHCDVPLSTIYGSLMKLRPRFISLESANHRHAHEAALFESLPFPEDKVLMPGVIDTRSNTVEHPDLVAQRLRRFAAALGAERVIGSTDCGFASTSSSTAVSGEVAWLKLDALVEGARRAGREP
jgi:5-methyltetrahydropteroyltriglutamate--homocysteine methyltransferase